MEVKIEKFQTYSIIKLLGELDLYSSFKLRELINSLLDENIKNCIIDFQDLKYIDSSGIGALIKLHYQLDSPGKSLWLVNVKDQVKSIIELTKLDEYFQITFLENAISKIVSNSQ